jgi:hypothetical protein
LELTGLAGHDSLALQQDERFAMAWNETDRGKYAVIRERYASDLSDEEYALIRPVLPQAKPRGRKPTDARAVLRRGFQNSRARLAATRNMHAACSNDWMIKLQRS